MLSNTGLTIFRCLAVAVIVVITGCTTSAAVGTNPPPDTLPEEPIPDKLASADDPVDITDAVLKSTEPSCADHVGTYVSTSDGTDVDGVDGQLTISVTNEICVFESNQIPNHEPGKAVTADETLDAQAFELSIPARAKIAPSATPVELGSNAILLNGVTWGLLFDACFDAGDEAIGTETAFCSQDPQNPWRYNTGSQNNDYGFDEWNAHLRTGGPYHYHAQPQALYDIDCEGGTPSPVVGFAPDGFPIFGPCFKDSDGTIRKATTSYQIRTGKRQDVDGYTTPRKVGNVASDDYDGQFNGDFEYLEGGGDLDQCNGMQVGETYGYYLTTEYPYVLACYSGTPLP